MQSFCSVLDASECRHHITLCPNIIHRAAVQSSSVYCMARMPLAGLVENRLFMHSGTRAVQVAFAEWHLLSSGIERFSAAVADWIPLMRRQFYQWNRKRHVVEQWKTTQNIEVCLRTCAAHMLRQCTGERPFECDFVPGQCVACMDHSRFSLSPKSHGLLEM